MQTLIAAQRHFPQWFDDCPPIPIVIPVGDVYEATNGHWIFIFNGPHDVILASPVAVFAVHR